MYLPFAFFLNPGNIFEISDTFCCKMLKLAPFVLAQALYWTRDPELRIASPLIKCTPILCLVLYLILKRDKWSSRGQGSDPKKVLLGLIFRYIYTIVQFQQRRSYMSVIGSEET